MPKVPTRRCTKNNSADLTNPKSTYRRHPKPPYSYVGLISQAIMTSPHAQLTLSDINDTLRAWFPFFRSAAYRGWMDSIRHNLSNNGCFSKVLRRPDQPHAKGNFWTVDVTRVKGVFVELQHTGVSRSGDFAPYLHQHLSLPSIWALEEMSLEERAKFSVIRETKPEVLTSTDNLKVAKHSKTTEVLTSKHNQQVAEPSKSKPKSPGAQQRKRDILGKASGSVVNAKEARVDSVLKLEAPSRREPRQVNGQEDKENRELQNEEPIASIPPPSILYAALNLYELANGHPHPDYVLFSSKCYPRHYTQPLSISIPDQDVSPDTPSLPNLQTSSRGPPLLQVVCPSRSLLVPTTSHNVFPHLWAALDFGPPMATSSVLHSFADIALAHTIDSPGV